MDESRDIERSLGRVEGKVDRLENDVKEIKAILQEAHAAISGRVGSLEHSRTKLLGTVGTISAVFGILGSWLVTHLLPRFPH